MTIRLNTYEKRLARVKFLINDPKSNLTAGESLALIYHWARFEIAARQVNKHKKWLDDTEKVYKLRRQLHDL